MGYLSGIQQSLILGKPGMGLMSQDHHLEEELGEIQIKEEAYKLRQKQREADSPEFISPHSTTDTMDTDEAQEINKQIIERIEKEPEGAEYLNVVSERKYENVEEVLDTGATFSTVTEMQAEAEKAQQTYEEIESLEDSHIVSFPKLDKEKEALRRKTQGNESLLKQKIY